MLKQWSNGSLNLEKTWLKAAGLSQIMMKNGAGFNPLEGSMSTKFPFLLLLIGKSNFQSKILPLDGAYLESLMYIKSFVKLSLYKTKEDFLSKFCTLWMM